MRRTLLIVAALSLVTVVSCSKNRARPPGNSEAQDSGWRIQLKSTCNANTATDQCVGAYGFSVLSDGRYILGPGPDGQQTQGTISQDELNDLQKTVSPFINGGPRADSLTEHPEICAENQPGEVPEQSITLSRASQERTLIHIKEGSLCYQTATEEDAKLMQKAISDLAEKYYTLPFPDGCLEQVHGVQSLYPEVQTCATDADCAYVGPSFEIIPSASTQWVAVDECRLLKPLAVANAAAMASNLQKIQSATEKVMESCGARMFRTDCTQILGFPSNQAPPVCNAGVCKVNPSVTY